MNRSAMWTLRRILSSLFLPLALAACSQESAAPPQAPPLQGAAIGGPFELVDEDGKTVRWADFDGQYRIVYFGYTYCPDACPMDVQAMMLGFSRFEDEHPELAEKVQPLFISIDPERDTPEIVREFTAAFHPRLLGLTGTPAQVEKAAKGFAAYYSKGEETPNGYLMDHSRIAYLMGPAGEPIAMLPVETKVTPETPYAEALKKAVADTAAELEKWVK